MQFIVFAAFAIVLSVPSEGPARSWIVVHDPRWVWAAVLGYIGLATLAGAITTHRVKWKLDQDPAWLPAAQRRLGKGNTLVRGILLVSFILLVYCSNWVRLVRGWDRIASV